MTPHEKWEYERSLQEIIDRLSDLIANIMLMSIKKISRQHQSLMDPLESNKNNDFTF
jgi:hypothetical protein